MEPFFHLKGLLGKTVEVKDEVKRKHLALFHNAYMTKSNENMTS